VRCWLPRWRRHADPHAGELRADGSWRGRMLGPMRNVLADCDTANLPDSLCVQLF
jgi:hypothetical protein